MVWMDDGRGKSEFRPCCQRRYELTGMRYDWEHAGLALFVFYPFKSCTENLNIHRHQSDTGGEQ